jgi:hypothetical protein
MDVKTAFLYEDVKTAFLYEDVEEDNYVIQPEGFESPG